MKRFFTLLLATGFILFAGNKVNGQQFFSEDFEGSMNAGTDLPTGWTESGLSTDGIWSTDNATNASSTYLTWPAPTNGSIFAFTNDDACNCDKSADLMVMPVQNFSGMAGVTLTFDLYLNGGYGEQGKVLASTNGGTTWDTVYTAVGDPANWQDGIQVNLNAYAGQSAVSIGFFYYDGATWAWAMGIDDVTLTQLASSEDLEVSNVDWEYTVIPVHQATALPLDADITNNGTSTVTDAVLNTNVWSSSNGWATPVYSISSGNNSVAASATVSVSNGTYNASTVADYIIEHYATSASITDGTPGNDTMAVGVIIDDSTYARDNGTMTGSLGIGAGNGGYLGQQFTLVNGADITSVTFLLNNANGTMTGQPVNVLVWDMAAGEPNAIVASTDTVIVSSDSFPVLTLPIAGGSYNLAAGDFTVTIEERDSNVVLATTTEIFTNGTTWIDWPTNPNGGWTNSEAFGAQFARTFILRPNLSTPCPTIAANLTVTDASCGNADGQIAAAPSGGAGPYTYVWSNGDTSGTATGLAVGTYTVTITDMNGCDVVESGTVANVGGPTLSNITSSNAPCFGDNGSATVSATGGTPGYTYLWSNGDTSSTIAAGAGTYSVTVTDANGCQLLAGPVTITEPAAALTLTAAGTDATCSTCPDGSASASGNGGTQPYTYAWSNGGSGASISGLLPGTYTVTVTDVNGCTATDSVVVDFSINTATALSGRNIDVYPNPSNGIFTLEVNLEAASDMTIEIYDMIGQRVYGESVDATSFYRKEISLNNVASGRYLVKVSTAAGAVTKKIVIE